MSHPTIFWAQNKQVVYLRIAVMGAEDVKCEIEDAKFTFSCTAQKQQYKCSFPLFKSISKEGSKYRVLGQGVEVLLKKLEEVKEFWTAAYSGAKLNYVRIDWERWQDEDEDEKPQKPINDFSGMDFGAMGGAGGMPDMSNFKMPEGDDEPQHEDEHEHGHDGCKCGDGDCKDEKKECGGDCDHCEGCKKE